MRIAIDGRWALRDLGGIRRHTIDLTRHLLRLDPDNDYLLLGREGADPGPLAELAAAPNASYQPLPYDLFSASNQLRLPNWLSRQAVDVYHSTNFMIPLLPGRRHHKVVVTIHDLIPYRRPDLLFRSKKTRLLPLFRAITRRAMALADRIITVSEFSRQDIGEVLPAAGGKVAVIYNGFEPRLAAEGEAWPSLAETHGLRPGYILYVGRQDPSKNLVRLIEAFARLPGTQQLVLAGPEQTRYGEPRAMAAKLGVASRVVFTGVVRDDELAALYRRAGVFAFVSLYEGFGLPPLEAMAMECPVVCADSSSLPEVVGEAAVMVEPLDIDSIAAGLRAVLESESRRSRLIQAGRERARRFTWEAAAAETLAVYRAVGGDGADG